MSSYNRLGSLTYASLLCMPSPPPSYLDLLLLYSVPWNVLLLLLFRSRCTVAFGLCIIITVTASSSWLLVEEPPRTHPIFTRSLLSHPHFLFCRLSFSLFVLRMREMKKRERGEERRGEVKERERVCVYRVACVRVCALIKFLRGYTQAYRRDLCRLLFFSSRLIARFDGLSTNQHLSFISSDALLDELKRSHVIQKHAESISSVTH